MRFVERVYKARLIACPMHAHIRSAAGTVAPFTYILKKPVSREIKRRSRRIGIQTGRGKIVARVILGSFNTTPSRCGPQRRYSYLYSTCTYSLNALKSTITCLSCTSPFHCPVTSRPVHTSGASWWAGHPAWQHPSIVCSCRPDD